MQHVQTGKYIVANSTYRRAASECCCSRRYRRVVIVSTTAHNDDQPGLTMQVGRQMRPTSAQRGVPESNISSACREHRQCIIVSDDNSTPNSRFASWSASRCDSLKKCPAPLGKERAVDTHCEADDAPVTPKLCGLSRRGYI